MFKGLPPCQPCHTHPHCPPRALLGSSADVFATFKDLLTRNKPLIAQFLADNYAEVCSSGRLWSVGLWHHGGAAPQPALLLRRAAALGRGAVLHCAQRTHPPTPTASTNHHRSSPTPHPPPPAQFFKLYTELLKSDNYVTRRQSLKLLGELLLDRSNVKIMMQVGPPRAQGGAQASGWGRRAGHTVGVAVVRQKKGRLWCGGRLCSSHSHAPSFACAYLPPFNCVPLLPVLPGSTWLTWTTCAS